MEENSVSVNEQRIRKLTSLYYSRPEIQKIIFDFSKNREICPRYFEGFGRRPDVLEYPGDVFGSVKKGATSFHCSEELWKDPLKIKTGMTEKQLNELRIGWDLCLPDFETIFIREDGNVKKITLKELAEKLKLNHPGRFRLPKHFEVLSINPQTYKIEYDLIKDLIIRKKKREEKLINISVEDGKEIFVSEDHLLLTFTKDGIKQKEAKRLSRDDYLLTPLKIDFPKSYVYFDIIEEIVKLKYNTNYKLKYKDSLISWILVEGENYYNKLSGSIKNFLSKSATPLNIYLLHEESKKNREKIRLRSRKSKLNISPLIELNNNFGKLVGYYLSEGSLDKDRLEFTFNKNEVKEGREVVSLFNDVFGVKYDSEKSITFHKLANSLKVRINSKLISILFRDIFGFKFKADKKEIPSWIYNAPEEFVAGLLEGYFTGDGCSIYEWNKKSVRIDALSASQELVEGLSTLCLKLGIHCNIIKHSRKNIIRISGEEGIKKFVFFCSNFIIKKKINFIPKKIRHPSKHTGYPSFLDKDLIKIVRNRTQQSNLYRAIRLNTRLNKDLILLAANKHLKKIIENNLFPIKIKKIEAKHYDGLFYDIETIKNHNFLHGSAIFTHNCLDIDSKYIDYSKIMAVEILNVLKFHGIKNVGVKFSVSGDTPILVKEDKNISLSSIFEVIENLKKHKKLEVLSLDKNRKLKFSKIYDFLEHKDTIYEINHSQSRIPLKATGHHSIFVWDRGEIIQKKVTELKKGDFLISYNSKENPFAQDNLVITNDFEFSKNQHSKKLISNKIKITKELMRLIGYFLAEGHVTNIINQVGFSFNQKETEYIEDVRSLLTSLTEKKISIRHPNSGSTQILIHSKEWANFFDNFCGKKKNKHVPPFAFKLSRELFIELLRGYIRGDGYKIGKYGIVVKSVSRRLITEFIWLCKLNNISCNISFEQNKEHKLPQGTIFKGSLVYLLRIPKSELEIKEFYRKRNKFSPYAGDNLFPIDGLKEIYNQIKPKGFNLHRAEQMTLSKKKANLARIKKVLNWFDKFKEKEYDKTSRIILTNYKKLFNSDISIVEIKTILKKNKEKVYDVSVEETESFFGNYYPVLLHNSGSKGFHLIIPWKAFPKEINGVKTSEKFPEWPRILVKYIIEQTRNKLIERISELERPNKYVRDYRAPKEVMPDLVLVSPRHLFRMPYSVDFDEPICTKKDKKINITKIGDFVDQFFKKEGKIQTADISHLDYKTPSLNFKDNNTRFSKINNVIRHKIDENIFSICLESGREVKVTSGHSLFVLRDSKIDTIKGNEIKLGDYIVVLKKIPENENKLNCINLTDELINISKEEKKNIFLFDFDKSVYDKLYTLKIPERKKTQIYNWKVYNILPLDAYEILIKKFPLLKSVFANSKIKLCKHGGAKVGIQNNLKVNKELMRLLGYYVSEGYCDCKRSRMNFSFGAHEEELIEDCVKILKSLNLNPRLRKPHETATQIEINSAIFNFILSFLFKCGKNALEKRVPSIIWNVDSELKKEFLKGYINGDGHIEKKWAKIIMSTASKGLQEDLCFLLNSLGRGYSLSKRKPTKWNKSNKDQYIIIVQGKRDVEELGFVSHSNRIKESLMERFPIRELGLEKLILASRLRNQYINKKIIDRNKDFIKKLNPPKEILNLINGDIAFLKVKEIKRINTQHKYVYDLSVENDENFVGGNCILLHNSLHEKTSLASIVLRQEEIENFNMKDADPMKLSSSEIRNFSPNSREGEASELLVQALDWYEGSNNEKEKEERDFSPIKLTNLSEDHFPPCIKNILKGLSDGKKRALFILINLFRSVGMDKDELEKRIYDWNKKNEVPLQDGYIKAQLSWAYKRKPIMPPNCKEFYQGIGVCEPDNFCRTLKNPINYVIRKNLRKDKK